MALKNMLSLWKPIARRRLFLFFMIELFLLPFLLALFFTPIPQEENSVDFAREKEALSLALQRAEEEFSALEPTQDSSAARQKLLFYQTVLVRVKQY